MKRKILLLLAAIAFVAVGAQNIQLHYDFGNAFYNDLSGRPQVTTTVEMFKADKWGSTFFFTDIDYFKDGAAGAYWEIAREFRLGKKSRWAAHVEYNGGLTSLKNTTVVSRFQHALLVGPAWNWASADFSRTFSVQALYKYYFKGQNPWNRPFSSFQATCVWGVNTANRMFTFSGFFDCWYDRSVRGNWITITEPQFWLNLNAFRGLDDLHLSLGTEVEISNKFIFDNQGRNDKFYAIPTIAMKWTF